MSGAVDDGPAGSAVGTGIVLLQTNALTVDDGLRSWLDVQRTSIVLASDDRLWLITRDADDEPVVLERNVAGAGALARWGNGIVVAGLWQLWAFIDIAGLRGGGFEGYDRALHPGTGHTLGSFGVQDVAMAASGPVFATARFNCLAVPDARMSLRPVWAPPWITDLAVDDACHVGGVAVVDGAPRFVTCAGTGTAAGSWRDGIVGGGVVIDVTGTATGSAPALATGLVATGSGAVVATGLTLPRSPRWVDGTLFVVDAGTGRLLRVDAATGATGTVATLPVLLTSLDVVGPPDAGVALMGWVQPSRSTVDGLPVAAAGDDALPEEWHGTGMVGVDLATGGVIGTARFCGRSTTTHGVVAMRGARRLSLAVPRGSSAQATVVVGPVDPLRTTGVWPAGKPRLGNS